MNPRGDRRQKAGRVPNRQAILRLLKRRGPSDSASLAGLLGISTMGVRQHLYVLRASGLVTYQEEPRPLGRPAKLWRLTPAAGSQFPDAHAGLTTKLLDAAEQVFGEAGVQRLLIRYVRQQVADYRSGLPARSLLRARLAALVALRNAEGFWAEARRQPDGSFLLIENHCPISAAANVCPKLCAAEMRVFRAILGEGVAIERTEHLLGGARHCVYRIRTGPG